MFDEQPDGDPHGECAAEIHNLRHLLGQCYAKLIKFGVENSDPFLMDELKLTLMQCYDEPAVSPAPTFADGMTAEDDRRFLELTNDLTHNYASERPAACGRSARMESSTARTTEDKR